MFLEMVTRNWWMFLVRGVLAILFGVVAWVWPDLTVTVLVILFGAYALVDGVFAIIAAIVAGGEGRWLPLLLAAVMLGGILRLAATPARAPIMLAIAATTLLRLALVTVKLGRRPAPGRMPQAVGSYIRLLLLLQATCCAARTEGLAVAAILIILMPVAAHLGRFYHAS